MFISGFHRLAFLFFLGCAALWFYVLNEWTLLVVAILAYIPLGAITSLLPAMLLGTVRHMGVSDVVLTWLPIVAGTALVVYAIATQEGTTLALMSLAGAGLIVGGASMFMLRLNAMRLRAQAGLADPDDVAFLKGLDQAKGKRTEPWGG